MIKYWLYVDGGERGCDYTIACNKLLIPLKSASTLDEAMRAAEEHYGDPTADPKRGYGCGEGRIESATILEVAHIHTVDLDAWAVEARAVLDSEERERKEREEKKQLAKLIEKHGVPPRRKE